MKKIKIFSKKKSKSLILQNLKLFNIRFLIIILYFNFIIINNHNINYI